jgi:hypothetical protein
MQFSYRFNSFNIKPLLALAALLPLAAHAAAGRDDDYAPGRLLVEAVAGLSDEDLGRVLKAHGGKHRKLGQSTLHVVDLPPSASATAVLAQLKHRPEFKFVELDRRVKSTYAANDPYAGSEWHLGKMGAATAWDKTQGAGITIAILDSGVDGSHPDLQPNLVAGTNVYGGNSDTSDVCGHGTAVAGAAAARTGNAAGVAGVAGQARIMPVRIAFPDPTYGCYAYYSTVASGLTYAADHGARIANVSYGGVSGSAAVQSAAQYMKSKGGLVFVSAGNNGISESIAPTSSMIVVSATDGNDAKASWSSYGSFVTLAAPGSGIWTTTKGGGYQAWNGTSFASPVAASVAALMMAANPALDPAKVQSLLQSTAVDLGAAGRDDLFGYGRVNAAAAVQAAASSVVVADTQAPSAGIAAPLGGASVSGAVAVSVNAADNVGVARVDLKVNGTVVASDSSAPYAFSWNSAGAPNGMASLVAVAYDAAGNAGASGTVQVNVANNTSLVAADTTRPVVVITNPTAGQVSGNVNVAINASDNSGAAGIRLSLYIDGELKSSGNGGSLSYNWNTRKIAAGAHTLQSVARDAAGNTSTATVQVNK